MWQEDKKAKSQGLTWQQMMQIRYLRNWLWNSWITCEEADLLYFLRLSNKEESR